MKPEFITYLTSIGMQSPLIMIIEGKYKIVELLNKSVRDDEIQDIFVEESFGEDGKRDYQYITFYTNDYYIEIKIFSPDNEVKIRPLNKNITVIQINTKNYEWEKANINSGLSAFCRFDDGGILSLKASMENCDYLKEILDKYMIPNLKID